MLTREKVRTFYDRFGALQDRQAFYEDIATRDLIAHANFEEAKTVFEFGCGTGRFAADLVGHRLAEKSSYTGCDLSATMVGIARGRLAQFGACAQVQLTDGTLHLAASDATFDRFVSNYVLDSYHRTTLRCCSRKRFACSRRTGAFASSAERTE